MGQMNCLALNSQDFYLELAGIFLCFRVVNPVCAYDKGGGVSYLATEFLVLTSSPNCCLCTLILKECGLYKSLSPESLSNDT